MSDPHPSAPVVVVGAGMAGLTTAAMLTAAGREVVVYEAGDGVGGRVRTDRTADGYLVDRGFQVLLAGYPALRRHVDLAAIGSRPFDAGAHVWTGERLVSLANPLAHPTAIVGDLTTDLFTRSDKVALAKLGVSAKLAPWGTARDAAGAKSRDISAEAALREAGFSDRFIERFARGFWGGITLDRSLSGSAGPLRFTLKMFLEGRAVLPAAGVQGAADRLAFRLPPAALRLNTRVDKVAVDLGRATGVMVNGEHVPASAVVVAADPAAARDLTGNALYPTEWLGCVTVGLQSSRDPGLGGRLVVDGSGTLAVNHFAPLSAVQPTYAPAGRHLVAAVFLGDEPMGKSDGELVDLARRDLGRLIDHDPAWWQPVAVTRVPYSQFRQPPGIYGYLPGTRTTTPGLFLAGEAVVDSSVNGAMVSGELAAAAVLDDLRRG
jgi:phytoene dehydrogenase-like protein